MEQDSLLRLREYESILKEKVRREASKLALASFWEHVPDCHVEIYQKELRELYRLFPEIEENR